MISKQQSTHARAAVVRLSYVVVVVTCMLGRIDPSQGWTPVAPMHHRTTITGNSRVYQPTSIAFGHATVSRKRRFRALHARSFYGDDEGISDDESIQHEQDDSDIEDDDEDDYIDTADLGDWRAFRRSLTVGEASSTASTLSTDATTTKASVKSASLENEALLQQQNPELAREYKTGVWAHETSTVRTIV
jgi:hypothetical protein